MNILSNLFTPTGTIPWKRREVSSGVPATTDPSAASNQQTTTGATFEEKIVRVRRPEMALTVSAVYRAVELRAKTEA